MSYPQLRRRILILKGLQAGRLTNCRILAEECEVSEKTIQRDIEILQQEGLPVVYDKHRHGYRLTQPVHDLPAFRIQLSDADLFALYLADKVLKQYSGTPLQARLQQVFDRIIELLPANRKPYAPQQLAAGISVLPEPARTIDQGNWDAVFATLQECRQLRLFYRKPGTARAERRTVEPCHVLPYRGDWYLLAWCTSRQAYRLFALSRMERAEPLVRNFAPHADLRIETYLKEQYGIFFSEKRYNVRLRFSPAQAPYIRERVWHPKQQLRNGRDGSVVLGFPTHHLFEVTRWVLSWGADVEVLAPPALQEEVERHIAALAERVRSGKNSRTTRAPRQRKHAERVAVPKPGRRKTS